MNFEDEAPLTDRAAPPSRARMGRALVRAVEETALEFARGEIIAAALAASRGWPEAPHAQDPAVPLDDVDDLAQLVFGPLLERAEGAWGTAYAERLMRRLEPVLDEAWARELGDHELELDEPPPAVAPRPDSYLPRSTESGVQERFPAPRDTLPSPKSEASEDWLYEAGEEAPSSRRYSRLA